MTVKLSGEVMEQILEVIQVAILEDTDASETFRAMRFGVSDTNTLVFAQDGELSLSPEVLGRVVDIFNDSLMSGVDLIDLLRQVELDVPAELPGAVVLGEEYRALIPVLRDKLAAYILERAKTRGAVVEEN